MRKKAEKKIRSAAAVLGRTGSYRIDAVREKTDLIRKVFDKTLLDMARLGTVELIRQDSHMVDPVESENLIRRGDKIYGAFRFTDPPSQSGEEPEPDISETTSIILKGIDRSVWRRFVSICTHEEGVPPAVKIKELIRDYIRDEGRRD